MDASPERVPQTSTLPSVEVSDQQEQPRPVPGDATFIGPLTAVQTVAQMVARGELSAKHLQVLRERAINDEVVLERGYQTVSGPVGALELEKRWSSGQKDPKRFPALAYPVHKVGDKTPYTHVLRPDNPRTSFSTTGKEKVTKLLQPLS